MKSFEHINPSSLDEALGALGKYGPDARVNAGGTDLIGCLRDEIWPDSPKMVINLKSIPELRYIEEDQGGLRIGAMTTLTEIEQSEAVQQRYPALAQAARRTASALLRNLGTLAGNICQENRCWYYRYPANLGGRIDCARKGGTKCLAMTGDRRYHSIFGSVNKCIAVNPSDTAPALMVLGADVLTSRRTVPIADFFSAENGMKSTVVAEDEIVTAVKLPPSLPGTRSGFSKLAFRKTIDFAIVNCAVRLRLEDDKVTEASICMNAVHPNPYVASDGAKTLIGSTLDLQSAQAAGESAVAGAKPLKGNRYKVQMVKTLVADTLLSLRDA